MSPTPKQARIIWFAVTAFAVGVILALFGAVIWGLGRVLQVLAPVLWPLAIAGVIAYLLDPVVDFFERHKVPRPRAIILVFIIAVSVVAALAAAVVPRLVFEARELAVRIPAYAAQIEEKAEGWIERGRFHFERFRLRREPPPAAADAATTNAAPVAAPETRDADRAVNERVTTAAMSWVTRTLPRVGSWIAAQFSRLAGFVGLLAGLALVPVYCFYFLKEKSGIQDKWTNYLPISESRAKDEIVFVLTSINDYLIVFFRGQVLVAMCLGVLYTVGFFAVGLNYALLVGVIAGALSIIPYLGAVLTIVPAVTLAAVQFRDWWHPLAVVGVFAAAQALEGLVISPKIIGDRVGLHPLTIIIAVMVGTTVLGGILGGILAIPLTAALRVLMFRYVWKRRR